MKPKSIPAALGAWLAAAAVWPTATPVRAADPEVSKNIIAVQLRRQGFECKNPISATRDAPDSETDEPAWILACEGVTYKVRLVPNMAAKVERLPDEQSSEQTAAPPQQP